MPTKHSLTEALGRAVSRVQSELHVCLPGRIERYDHTRQRADVVPLLRSVYADGQVTEPQVISNVPVVFPRSGGASLTMPVKRGDGVMLHFADASIDEWLSSGGVVSPSDRRRHDLSDCIAVPGLYSFADTTPQDNNTDVRLQYDGTELRIKPGGVMEISNNTRVTVNTDNATINADQMTINADVAINGGSLTHNGTNVGDTHVHSQGNDSANNTQQDTDGPK